MLRESGLGISLFINVIIICLWVFISYLIAGHVAPRHADYRKYPYIIRTREKKGSFYTESFRIQDWYGILPSKLNRSRITKDHLFGLDALKLKELLAVTCRCELCAVLNCFYIICAALLDAPYLAFILGSVVILASLPFIAASRYCRCLILNELMRQREELKKQTIRAERSPNVFDLGIF